MEVRPIQASAIHPLKKQNNRLTNFGKCLSLDKTKLKMRETILIDALAKAIEVIKQWHDADDVWDIYWNMSPEMKPIREALSDYESPAPESGGEETWVNWSKPERIFKIINWLKSQQEFTSKSWTTEGSIFYHVAPNVYADLIDRFMKDFVPNKSNSNVTPVASHPSTSSNSIEHD